MAGARKLYKYFLGDKYMGITASFDLIVVGGGTGGLRAAYKSALAGYKTALVDPGVLGGTCLNMGCIPTKAMLHASGLFDKSKRLKEFGIRIGKPRVNFKSLMKRVLGIVGSGQRHVEESVKTKNLEVIREKAKFVGPQAIKAGEREFFGKKIIIATGSRSRKLEVKGSEEISCMDVAEVLKLKKLPKSIAIVGAGYIAMEFATFFNQLGVDVTVIESEKRVLPFVDSEISGEVFEEYEKKGVRFRLRSEVVELGNRGRLKGLVVKDSSGKKSKIFVDEILVAIGRVPNTENLDLKRGGVETDSVGAIRVNDFLQTTNKNIYAIGDVIGRAPFAHAARAEALIALENSMMKGKKKMDFSKVGWSVFTSPPVSGVGMGEAELKKKKIKYGALRARFSQAGRTTVIGETTGLLKVFYNKRTEKILGAVIFGARADELIHEFVTLLHFGGTVKKMREIIHVHPTVSEVISACRD
jgi:dihydrolipoamide dehydrogenase